MSQDALAQGCVDNDFYQAKLFTAKIFLFTFGYLELKTHATTMLAGADTLQGLDQEHFSF